ncbi:MAG TPA: hypothetical protein VFG90_10030 [Nitrososphaeraceae archaeon]|nr:hypothetical protein [Nitrososphaeraceae archaeon]
MIIGLAVSIHLRLSAVESGGHKEGETAEEVMNEILTGQPAHTEEANESEAGHIEESKELSHSEHEASEEAEHEENR